MQKDPQRKIMIKNMNEPLYQQSLCKYEGFEKALWRKAAGKSTGKERKSEPPSTVIHSQKLQFPRFPKGNLSYSYPYIEEIGTARQFEIWEVLRATLRSQVLDEGWSANWLESVYSLSLVCA